VSVTPDPVAPSDDEPPGLPQGVLFLGAALLFAGLVTTLAGGQSARWTKTLVDLGLAAIVAVPVLNVVGVLVVEWQRRERVFAWAAAIVLAMLALNVFWR
jgi:uncharacterized membrane protein